MTDPRHFAEWHQREPDPTEADRAAWHRLQRSAMLCCIGFVIIAAMGVLGTFGAAELVALAKALAR